MPAYDYRCSKGCGVFEDVIVPIEKRHDLLCPDCEQPLKMIPPVVRTTGIVFSNALEIKQIGRSFKSNAELREYQRENKVEFHASNSKAWRDHKDWAREKCESKAKKMGFRDHESLTRARRDSIQTKRPLADY